MRPRSSLFILIIAFVICSCNATQLNPEIPCEVENPAGLLATAENLMQSNSYEKALKVYHEFLDCYPSDSNADNALMRIATIYSIQKKYDLSRKAYQRLSAEYPFSEFAMDARIEITIPLPELCKIIVA